MDGRANAGNDNISRQKLTPKKRHWTRPACQIALGDGVRKQKGRHCADLSYRYDVLRQYIRGRGPKANCLQ